MTFSHSGAEMTSNSMTLLPRIILVRTQVNRYHTLSFPCQQLHTDGLRLPPVFWRVEGFEDVRRIVLPLRGHPHFFGVVLDQPPLAPLGQLLRKDGIQLKPVDAAK